MIPFIQKLPVAHGTTFVATTFKTPHFEVPWHQHTEMELILFTEGGGKSFIGSHVGSFVEGDIYFIGANVPHTFQRYDSIPVTSAVVIQFNSDFWGESFLELPESKSIKKLFMKAANGIKISGISRQLLYDKITMLEHQSGFERIINLCTCLNIIANDESLTVLSNNHVDFLLSKGQKRLNDIIEYTKREFYRPISLPEIAGVANMSIPAFSQYFKKSVKKTYIEFLNEWRLNYACNLLIDTDLTISEIYLKSGFNNPANFNKQFLQFKGTSPFQYRKNALGRLGMAG